MSDKNPLAELLAARIPAEYAAVAALPHTLLKEIGMRLDLVALQPQTIADVGCVTEENALLLKEKYPAAEVYAVDPSSAMTELPFPDSSIDLLVANLVLPWCAELEKILPEWRRVLRAAGLVIFTAFGPDTLKELHTFPLAFPQLMDMHVIGDLLVAAGFVDPVLDVDYFTLIYQDEKKLWQELQATGMITGKIDLIQLKKPAAGYSLTHEIIFGHAWVPATSTTHRMNQSGEVAIPVSHIVRAVPRFMRGIQQKDERR